MIHEETWRVIFSRVPLHRDPMLNQIYMRALGHNISALLNMYRRRKAAESGAAVEYLLAYNKPLIKEACWRMQGWYKDATNRPPPSACVTITMMTVEKVALYMRVPPSGENITVGIKPFTI